MNPVRTWLPRWYGRARHFPVAIGRADDGSGVVHNAPHPAIITIVLAVLTVLTTTACVAGPAVAAVAAGLAGEAGCTGLLIRVTDRYAGRARRLEIIVRVGVVVVVVVVVAHRRVTRVTRPRSGPTAVFLCVLLRHHLSHPGVRPDARLAVRIVLAAFTALHLTALVLCLLLQGAP